MSHDQESCQLRADEIVAVLSLAGRQSVVGFQTEEIKKLTTEKIWNACCRLVRDRMMTQIGGKFRLCQTLVDVMEPVCKAESILALTPESDLIAQVIYYCADRVVSMERTPYGRYILTPMEMGDLVEDLKDRMDISDSEEAQDSGAELEIDVQYTDSRERLLQDAVFVLERLDSISGVRQGWLRLVSRGMDRWIQWTEKEIVCCEELTEPLLEQRLQALQRGETQ